MDPGEEESQIEDHREDETNDSIPSTPVVAATTMELDEALLRSAVPLFLERVDAVGDRCVQQTRESEANMTQMLLAATEQIKAITERSKAMERKVDLMMTQLDWVCGPMGMGTLATLLSAFTNASSSAGARAALPPYPSSTGYPAGTPFSGNLPSSSSAPPTTVSPTPPLPPAFKMDRTITSVVDLWREYSEGIGGRPSLHSMYVLDKCHSFGKDGDTERRHFQRRNVIFKHIVLLATTH